MIDCKSTEHVDQPRDEATDSAMTAAPADESSNPKIPRPALRTSLILDSASSLFVVAIICTFGVVCTLISKKFAFDPLINLYCAVISIGCIFVHFLPRWIVPESRKTPEQISKKERKRRLTVSTVLTFAYYAIFICLSFPSDLLSGIFAFANCSTVLGLALTFVDQFFETSFALKLRNQINKT